MAEHKTEVIKEEGCNTIVFSNTGWNGQPPGKDRHYISFSRQDNEEDFTFISIYDDNGDQQDMCLREEDMKNLIRFLMEEYKWQQ